MSPCRWNKPRTACTMSAVVLCSAAMRRLSSASTLSPAFIASAPGDALCPPAPAVSFTAPLGAELRTSFCTTAATSRCRVASPRVTSRPSRVCHAAVPLLGCSAPGCPPPASLPASRSSAPGCFWSARPCKIRARISVRSE
ncbi:hypothetical protein T484DRAFT_1935967 [Baffinella frigidus]|nr:hypothetical protein T484DRAFT_1935967 [Cryptophyta sp. CCMP2293]